jgi:prenyltransferase beta subunit
MLEKVPKHAKRTLNFLVNRQTVNLEATDYVGVQGRVGKFPDSCYSFWVGASIRILTGRNLLNPKVENFIGLCFKEKECSFSKYPSSSNGDPVHTAHSLVGVKLARSDIDRLRLEKGTFQ